MSRSDSSRGSVPWLEDADVTLYHGDVLAVLPELAAESVDCVVTSPPYWGLRDYGTGAWDGGDGKCDHLGVPFRTKSKLNENWGAGFSDVKNTEDREPMGQTCSKCGATRIDQQLGLEPTPEQYVERMVEVFREVRRVLAAHGTVWLNLGDSYSAGTDNGKYGPNSSISAGSKARGAKERSYTRKPPAGLKPKDLVGIPWRVAFALQADGWYLRSDIIWAKPNPMPESVTDRPTKAHEYVFLLSKQPRYFFDQEAVREPALWERWGNQTVPKHNGTATAAGWIKPKTKAELEAHRTRSEDIGRQQPGNTPDRGGVAHPAPTGGRNIRSVWEIATQPFSGRELFGGDGRIPSPDCPVHGDHPVPVPTGRRGGRGDASSPHIQRTDDRPVQESLDGPAPTEQTLSQDSVPASSDSPLLASTVTAIPSSTRTRKTSSRSDERDTADAGTLGRTPDSAPSHELPALGDFDSPEKSETPGHTSRTGRPCTCKYIDHFATFPEELARRCIAAGCPEQVCRVCGKARERMVEKETTPTQRVHNGVYDASSGFGKSGWLPGVQNVQTLGFTDCSHADYRPGITLDPFMGSGTVAHVARKLGRHAVGIDLNESYLELAARRLQQQSLFAETL